MQLPRGPGAQARTCFVESFSLCPSGLSFLDFSFNTWQGKFVFCCSPLSQGHVSLVPLPYSTFFPGNILAEFCCFLFIPVQAEHCDLYAYSQVYLQSFFYLIKRTNNSIFVLIYISLSANTFRSKVYVPLYWKTAQEVTVSDVRGWMLCFTTQPWQVIKPAWIAGMHSCFLSVGFLHTYPHFFWFSECRKGKTQNRSFSQSLVLVFRHITSFCQSVGQEWQKQGIAKSPGM